MSQLTLIGGYLYKKLFLPPLTENAFAHTELESSTPKNGEVIIEELQEIILKER